MVFKCCPSCQREQPSFLNQHNVPSKLCCKAHCALHQEATKSAHGTAVQYHALAPCPVRNPRPIPKLWDKGIDQSGVGYGSRGMLCPHLLCILQTPVPGSQHEFYTTQHAMPMHVLLPDLTPVSFRPLGRPFSQMPSWRRTVPADV